MWELLDLCPTDKSTMLPRTRHRRLSLWGEQLYTQACFPRTGAFDAAQLPFALNWCVIWAAGHLRASSVPIRSRCRPFKPNNHQVPWALYIVKDRLHPALFNALLLSKEQPAIDSNNALHNPCAKSHQAPNDTEILLCICPLGLVVIDHFACEVSRSLEDHLAINWIL